jgi:hypothetical protein
MRIITERRKRSLVNINSTVKFKSKANKIPLNISESEEINTYK